MALTKISGSILKDPLNLGEVSIGGTLTYQDVTNVDSVGIITARGNVEIGGFIKHLGDTNTMIGFPSDDTFSVTTNNVTRMTFTGNFIDLPDAGTFRFGNSNDLQIYHGSGGQSNIIHSNTSQPIRISATGAGTIAFDTNSTERLRITPDGEVKIMNTSGTVGLYFQSSSGAVSNFRAVGTNNQSLGYFFGNTERVRFLSNGTVGINTTEPQNSARFQNYTSSSRHQSFQSTDGDLAIVSDNNSNPVVYVKGTGNANLLTVLHNTNERFRITSDGCRVGNNASFSAHTAADDLVVGSTSGSNGMTILTGSGTGNIFFNDGSGNDGVVQYVHSENPNYMRIASSGWIRLSAGGNNHGGGIFTREKTCTTSGTNVFRFYLPHGALAGTLYAIGSNNANSVSKVYAFAGHHGSNDLQKIADSGSYSGNDFTVSCSSSGSTHTFSCTTSGANNVEISFTFHMGAPNQNLEYTEL